MVGGAMTSVARVHIFPLSYPAHYPPLDFLLHSTLHLTSYPLTISFFFVETIEFEFCIENMKKEVWETAKGLYI